jgi:hypothetical protein
MFGARIEFATTPDPYRCTYEIGGSSSSKASTSTDVTTTNIDKRQVVDSGAVGVTADDSNVYVTNTQTDQGALALSGGISAGSLALAGGIAAGSLEAFRASINNTEQTTGRALGFAQTSVDRALDFTTTGLSKIIDLGKSGTQAVGQSLNDVLGFADKALTLTRDNIKLQTTSAAQIGDAYKTAGDISSGNRAIATTGLVIAGIVATGVMLVIAFKSQGGRGAALTL